MEILIVAGAGLAVAAAVNAAGKNNPDFQIAQQEKAAQEALKKAQKKRNPNPAEIAQLEQNLRSISIERKRQTMERSEQKMVKYRKEGSIAKADKHQQRAASLRAELTHIAPHVLNQQQNQHQNQQHPQPYGSVMTAIPVNGGHVANSPHPSTGHKGTFAHSPQATAGNKGTIAQWPSASSSSSGSGPYTLGDYKGAPAAQPQSYTQHNQPNQQHPYNTNSQQQQYNANAQQHQYHANAQHQQNYNHQPQSSQQYAGGAPQNRGAALPEAREVLRTPAVSALPQFQGSQHAQQAPFSGTSYNAGPSASSGQQPHPYTSNNFPAAPASNPSAHASNPSAHQAHPGQRAALPEAREVLRTPDVTPMAQFQSRPQAPGGPVVHLTSDMPPPSYTPATNAHDQQQSYQNNPPPAYDPDNWVPSKK